jgi:Methyltransferase domain
MPPAVNTTSIVVPLVRMSSWPMWAPPTAKASSSPASSDTTKAPKPRGVELPAVADFISLPFYDLFAENGHVPKVRENLPPLLTGVRRSILEIGAGTGLITTSLADWTPAEIFALEPSAGMRGILLSWLSSRPELLDRVTVLPCDALSVTLGEPVEAVVMINVMYALEPDYRRQLWPVLAESLETGGLLVFTWRDGGPPAPRPLQELGSRQVGRHTYTVLSEILDADGETCRARYLHRITEGDKIISEEELTGYAYRPPWNVLERELATAGFAQAEGAEGLLTWRLA